MVATLDQKKREREEAAARLEAKMERMEAIEQYKEAMMRELQSMRSRLRQEEQQVKRVLAAARSTAEVEAITSQLAAGLGLGPAALARSASECLAGSWWHSLRPPP